MLHVRRLGRCQRICRVAHLERVVPSSLLVFHRGAGRGVFGGHGTSYGRSALASPARCRSWVVTYAQSRHRRGAGRSTSGGIASAPHWVPNLSPKAGIARPRRCALARALSGNCGRHVLGPAQVSRTSVSAGAVLSRAALYALHLVRVSNGSWSTATVTTGGSAPIRLLLLFPRQEAS